MNPYIQDLQTRAPGLFLSGYTEYTGTYIGMAIDYTVTNKFTTGYTQVGIAVPIEDAAAFEAALRDRIQEMNA